MGEDYTYQTVETLADVRRDRDAIMAANVTLNQRARELEAQLNAAVMRWNAVPIDAILALYDGTPSLSQLDTVGDWLCDVCPSDADDDDAPLKLAQIDDEDGDL